MKINSIAENQFFVHFSTTPANVRPVDPRKSPKKSQRPQPQNPVHIKQAPVKQ